MKHLHRLSTACPGVALSLLAAIAAPTPAKPKFDTTTPFSAAAVHQSDGGSTTYTIPTVVFAEPV
jgi:hypothetical protein